MSELNEDIDSYFKESIEPSEMMPSTKVWSTLDQKLDKKQFINLQKKINRLLFLTLGLSAIVAVLLTMQFDQYFQKNRNKITQNTISNAFVANSGKTSNEPLKQSEEAKSRQPIVSDNLSNKSIISFSKTYTNPKPVSNNHINTGNNTDNPISNSDIRVKTKEQITSEKNQVKAKESDNKNDKNRSVSNEKRADPSENIVLNGNNPVSSNEHANSNNDVTEINHVSYLNQTKTAETQDSIINSKAVLQNIVLTKSDSSENKSMASNYNKIDTIVKTDSTFPSANLNTAKNLEQTRENKFSLVAFFSPEYNAKQFSDNNSNDNQKTGEYTDSESPDFSYTTGLKIGYPVSKRGNVYSGLTFSSMSYTIKPKILYAQATSNGQTKYVLNTSSGEVDLPASSSAQVGDSIKTGNSIQQLQFISIPVLFQYQVSGKKFDYYAYAGVSSNFFIAGKTEVRYEAIGTESTTKIEGLRKVYFTGVVGIGMHYNISNRFSILAEPNFKKALTSINKSTPISSFPYSFGFAAGLIYHF